MLSNVTVNGIEYKNVSCPRIYFHQLILKIDKLLRLCFRTRKYAKDAMGVSYFFISSELQNKVLLVASFFYQNNILKDKNILLMYCYALKRGTLTIFVTSKINIRVSNRVTICLRGSACVYPCRFKRCVKGFAIILDQQDDFESLQKILWLNVKG